VAKPLPSRLTPGWGTPLCPSVSLPSSPMSQGQMSPLPPPVSTGSPLVVFPALPLLPVLNSFRSQRR
jgi:hypothetical protein